MKDEVLARLKEPTRRFDAITNGDFAALSPGSGENGNPGGFPLHLQ